MKRIFILEHLEKRVWKWCRIEYKHISEIIGKNNLWFTNIKRKNKYLENLGKTFKKKASELNLTKVCILDPNAKKELTPKEAEKFKYFIFGGILGDYPPKKRTKKELPLFKGAEKRNLGKGQFPTDNAFYVTKQIIKGKKISDLKFQNKFILKLNEFASITLPFKYVLVNNQPLIRKEIITYLKRKRGF